MGKSTDVYVRNLGSKLDMVRRPPGETPCRLTDGRLVPLFQAPYEERFDMWSGYAWEPHVRLRTRRVKATVVLGIPDDGKTAEESIEGALFTFIEAKVIECAAAKEESDK